MILGAILAPSSTLYDPLAIILGYVFGVYLFMIFDAILDHFWLQIYSPGCNPERHFFFLLLFFLGLAPGIDFGWILMDFGPICDGFLMDFGWILMDF